MSEWTLHWLEAEGDLSEWREAIAAEIDAARRVVATLIEPPRLDIIVQWLAGCVIPEVGIGAHAWRKSLFSLTVDPDNERLASSLVDGMVQRLVTHEVHHCLRYASIGYGRTLGEALVSEGLAGQFVKRLFGSPPEPWERAVDDATLRANWPDSEALTATDYDHAGWFYGRIGARPRWLGYTLGYRIAGDWLAAGTGPCGEGWVDVPAETVLAAAGVSAA